MYCTNCGKPIPEESKFCTHCGHPVEPDAPPAAETSPVAEMTPAPETPPVVETPAPAETPAVPDAPPAVEATPEPPVAPAAPKPKKRKGLIITLVSVLATLVVVAVVLGIIFISNMQRNSAYTAALSAGRESLSDGDYSAAVEHFQEALELSPNDPAAALGLAEAYLHQGEMEKAADTLEGPTYSGEDDQRYAALLSVAEARPGKLTVDADNFPTVTVRLDGVEAAGVDLDSIRVTEGPEDRILTFVGEDDGAVTFSYLGDETARSDEHRDFSYTLEKFGISLSATGDYVTPHFEQAQVRLVSTDVSAYPTVKVYFRVEGENGQKVEGLDGRAFIIRERIQGGQYLSREVHAAGSMERQGLNIDLVADKSDSIDDQMGKMQQVMTEFVHSLDYAKGDRAEVLAFDDIVQQMCYYSNDVTLLVNGINNMSTDGMTAFYDAVHKGVLNARLQGGARCVIAFTDGMDNRSHYSAQDVINYANSNQVPVYIIGVGSAVSGYASTLRNIAGSTGGRYWYIDDLYDLGEIYEEIYAEQQELYVVEYESDPKADQYANRDLQVTVSGGGYKGETSVSFTPVPSVGQKTHTSRYELVVADLTWEEASQRCQEMGGHLATVTSQSEEDQLIAMAEAQGVEFVWLGGYTSYNGYGDVFGHWVTGEDFAYSHWGSGEPSRQDLDGTPEWYIMLWKIRGAWSWNDQRNDPLSAVSAMKGKTGFVCEYES